MAHIQPAETETVKIFMYIFMECEMENDTPGNKYPKMKKVSNKTSKPLRSHMAPSLLPPRGTEEENVSCLQLLVQDLDRRCCFIMGESAFYESTFQCMSYTS